MGWLQNLVYALQFSGSTQPNQQGQHGQTHGQTGDHDLGSHNAPAQQASNPQHHEAVAPSPSITVAGDILTASRGKYVYNHMTLSPGGPAITVAGKTYSLLAGPHASTTYLVVKSGGHQPTTQTVQQPQTSGWSSSRPLATVATLSTLSTITRTSSSIATKATPTRDPSSTSTSGYDSSSPSSARASNGASSLLSSGRASSGSSVASVTTLFDVVTALSASSTSTSVTSLTSTSTPCAGNTASSRAEWCDFSVDTDYYSEVPDTGVTREYWFNLQEVTVAPDGIERIALTVNGSIPGPTIEADWGDTVVVHVMNSFVSSMNGTSIHFHGIRQNYTNQQDGVVSITQCPTAPGENYTYTWRATQYGSTWYHSHFALQAWEGVFGGIQINGPATANYDVDLGHIFLNDWSHETSSSLAIVSETSGPPTLENALINGTNIYDDAGVVTGSRFETTWEAGTSYRLRLVNGAIDTHFKFSVDNHTMTVIANDLVPIVPYNTTVLNIGMGQRYDVIITADQESVATDFWLRAVPQTACSNNASPSNIKGIVRYLTSSSASSDEPTTTGYDFTDECVDELTSDLVPWVTKDAQSGTSLLEAVTLGRNAANYNRWYMNSTSMVVEWNDPSLLQVSRNDTDFTDTSGVVRLDAANEWVVFVIDTAMPVPHPIHLHGHDFNVLAQGTGSFDAEAATALNLVNPHRRDVALLPAAGYLVIAFETDNPGAWLMHCHIGWHTSEGFAIQILERWDEIAPLIDAETLEGNCAAWDSYVEAYSVGQDDSGV